MNEKKFNQQNLHAYLLGALPAAEAERFDELSFTDDEFAAALRFAENDLVDAYAAGELSGADLAKFEAHYLASSLRRDRIEFAKSFQVFAERNNSVEIFQPSKTESETERNKAGFFPVLFANLRFWQVGFAAAVALMIFGGWLLVENSRPRNESLARQAELEQRETQLRGEIAAQTDASAEKEKEAELARVREESARVEKEREQQQQITESKQRQNETLSKQKPKETQKPIAAPRSPIVAFFALTPQLRGGNLPTISVPANADTVAMRLELEPHDFTRYRVALKNQMGERILWQSGNLKTRTAGENKILNVSFPARLLQAQTYTLEVSGIGADGKPETIGDYFFRNVR